MPEFFTALGIAATIFILAIIFFLSLKGTLTVCFDGEFSLSFKVLCFNIKLLPIKEKKKRYRKSMSRRKARKIRRAVEQSKERKRALKEKILSLFKKEGKESSEQKVQVKETLEKKEEAPKIPVKLLARETIDLVAAFTEIVGLLVKRFAHHLKIKILRLKRKIATGDPAITAVTYGSVTSIISVLLPILDDVENLKLPRKRELDITADFLSDTTEVDLKVSFSIRVWHFADITLRSLIGGLSKYVNRKGGIDNTFRQISELIEGFTPPKEDSAQKHEIDNK